MVDYQRDIEALLMGNIKGIDWEKEYKFFKIQLKNLQHERLIHLLVTLGVGLATLISALVLSIKYFFPTLLICGILLPLFMAYVFYYFKLENITQHWYLILKELREKSESDNKKL